jgi:hypothetical protein
MASSVRGPRRSHLELDLACPNPNWQIDVYLVTHHGMNMSDWRLVHALHPRVAIINRSQGRLAGDPNHPALARLEDIWQLAAPPPAGPPLPDSLAPTPTRSAKASGCDGRPRRIVHG